MCVLFLAFMKVHEGITCIHYVFLCTYNTFSPCTSDISKSFRIGVLFVNCLDDNQQVILLSYYFSKSFVLVSRWTLQGYIFSGLTVLL